MRLANENVETTPEPSNLPPVYYGCLKPHLHLLSVFFIRKLGTDPKPKVVPFIPKN